MTYTDEQIKELAEIRYGTDMHRYAAQRDGFEEGFKEALKQVKDIAYEPVLETVKCDCLLSGSCVYEKMICDTKQECRHKM
jgi:hypothetical protein